MPAASSSEHAGSDHEVSESLNGHQTFSIRPLAAERYIASSTSTARMPVSPGALLLVFRPRQMSTSTRSGSSQA